MANLGQFNAAEVEQFSGIPVDTYVGMLVNSVMKPNKGGEALVLEVDVVDGKYSGRKVFVNLNLKNSNETTVKIAEILLAQLCLAVGKPAIQDSTELHGKRFLMDVFISEGSGGYGPQNQVKKFHAITGTTTPVADTSNAPWKK